MSFASSSRNLSLSIDHLTFAYPGQEPLFRDLSLSLSPGWTAILGDNGIGKTTLVRLLLGLESQPLVSGTITPRLHGPHDPQLVIGYCEQDSTEPPANLDDFGADWSPETMVIRTTLGIGDDWPYRFSELSGGQRKRLQIACTLARHPDILVLDEPTNYVDEPTRTAIARTLRLPVPHRIGLLISHDRDLIDALADRCVFLTRRHVGTGPDANRTVALSFSGGYTQAAAQMEQQDASSAHALRSARDEARRLSVAQDRLSRATAHAESLKNSGRRINPKDHDARAKHRLARMTSLDRGASAASARIARQAADARTHAASLSVATKRYGSGLTDFFGAVEPSHRRLLVSLPAQTIGFGTVSCQAAGPSDHPSTDPSAETGTSKASTQGLRIPDLEIGPRDHIGLTGANGTGKTTLVRRLLRALGTPETPTDHPQDPASPTALPDWVLSIDQETGEGTKRRALHELADLDSPTRARVLTGYAQLNSDPDRLAGATPGSPISPGELRKLLLCLGFATHAPKLIILDEPTNHLDLGSTQALAAGLHAYRGALLLVSHDRRFLKDCTSIAWHLDATGASGDGDGKGTGTSGTGNEPQLSSVLRVRL